MSATHEQELTDTVGAKVTEEQKRKIRIAAANDHMNVSEWVRQQLLDAAEDSTQ